ncbi:FAD-dependent oxidoreductase [Leptolyngbya sp. AN02str]|uniref:FAD-dependent oxidoreductase n=1 Tax=Leptolyngbya sp. AN02str TaxID=3423363 RepID=UPI003D3139ED
MIRFFASRPLTWLLPLCGLFAGAGSAVFLTAFERREPPLATNLAGQETVAPAEIDSGAIAPAVFLPNGRPSTAAFPQAAEVWECEVAVVGGSLGGIAAAAHAMESGARTCLIELTPWLGGQVSSQGVSAIDESLKMLNLQNFSRSWLDFKGRIEQQTIALPAFTGLPANTPAANTNNCWVGRLCFPPEAGANASREFLENALQFSPGSRWAIATAFKGADFNEAGDEITAIYAVQRRPHDLNYVPSGRLSVELQSWYSWESDHQFRKVPIRLQPPAGKQMMVIDATDTGELVAWSRVPYRLGSESKATSGEPNASNFDNPECTQAYTFPFALALHNDNGESLKGLDYIKTFYPKHEHDSVYSMDGAPMFAGRSLFNYRRIVSTTYSNAFNGTPAMGDISMVNWTRGNDWNWMNPPLILTEEKLSQTNQYQNWMGGLSILSLRHGENHALSFAQWLLQNQSTAAMPLTYLSGPGMPMNTESGLSMVPYFREGRRIVGRAAYGDTNFMMREPDIRIDMEGRDFSSTSVAVTHYGIDIHGCRYRNWEPTGEASRASVKEHLVRPIQIPLEALIPQGVDNLLIGGKAIAASHIVNAATRVHYGEWSIGAAAGSTAGWIARQNQPELTPAAIVPNRLMPRLYEHMSAQGIRTHW